MENQSIFPYPSEIPDFIQLDKRRGRVLIGGKIESEGFAFKEVLSPCALRGDNGTLFHPHLGDTPNVDQETFARAVSSAVTAWAKGRGEWPAARMEQRIAATTAFRDKLLPHRETLAKYLAWEIAKPWPDALAEFDRTITYINDTLEAVKGLDRDGSRIHFAGGIMAQIRRMPLGVTLCIGPFNYPLNETFTTLIPALLMGNTVVMKTPRFGQLFWDVLLDAFQECFPPGVINIVNGLGRNVIGPSVQAGKIDVLALIGSSKTANLIKQCHPRPNSFRGVLGLDAKNPGIVLPDANLDLTLSECLKGSLSFNGQRCTALKILFVHRSVAGEFSERFAAGADKLKAGMPWENGVAITPLPHPGKVGELKALMHQAIAEGAVLANPGRGGKSVENLLFPTVLRKVSLTAALAHEEQFGPVVPIAEYDSLRDLEDYLLDSPYGMQASIFGENPQEVGELVDLLSSLVCRINLNSQCQRGPDVFPFTGRKASAEGTLSVADALRCFSIRSMVATKQDEGGKALFRSILESDSSRFLSTNIVL